MIVDAFVTLQNVFFSFFSGISLNFVLRRKRCPGSTIQSRFGCNRNRNRWQSLDPLAGLCCFYERKSLWMPSCEGFCGLMEVYLPKSSQIWFLQVEPEWIASVLTMFIPNFAPPEAEASVLYRGLESIGRKLPGNSACPTIFVNLRQSRLYKVLWS